MTVRQPAHRSVYHDERGIALGVALMAIVVIGALVGGTLLAGRLEMGGGRAAMYATQAQEQAEAAVNDAMIAWDVAWNTRPTLDAWSSTPTVFPATGVPSTRRSWTITKMGGNLFWITGTGERLDASGNSLGTRRVSRFARITHPTIQIEAAVTAKGNVMVGGNAEVTGMDQNPPDWACSTTLDDLGGVRTTGTVSVAGTASVAGDPPKIEGDATVTDPLFTEPFNAIAPLANHIFPTNTSINTIQPSITGAPAVCNQADNRNWGEPYRSGGYVPECTTYFPVILFNASARLQDGRGQGIILVRGDLELRGNFIWDGIVIVLGEIRTNGTGNKVTGAILANNATLGDLTSFAGDPDVLYSSCAIAEALQNSARATFINDRSWAAIY